MSASYLVARDIMSAPVFTVIPGDTVAHARNLMVRHKISRVLVMDGEKLSGCAHEKRYRVPHAAGSSVAEAPARPDPGIRICDARPGGRRARNPDQDHCRDTPCKKHRLRTGGGSWYGYRYRHQDRSDEVRPRYRPFRYGTGRDGGCSDGQPLALSCPRDHAHEGAGQETGGDQ